MASMNPIHRSLLVTAVAALLAPAVSAAAAGWAHPKTPWGDPDLQGTWPITHLMATPLERPEKYGTRAQFTAEELAEQKKAVDAQNQRYQQESSANKLGMGHWVEETDTRSRPH
jgi:hypothetical protein